jgi:dienelactone hydrolase
LPEVDEGRVGIIGYSFGASVALAAADERLAAVAAISLPSFGQALPDLAIRCPTLLISGDRDEFSPADSLPALAEAIGPHCQTTVIGGADHFWWSYEMELAETVVQFFRRYVIG